MPHVFTDALPIRYVIPDRASVFRRPLEPARACTKAELFSVNDRLQQITQLITELLSRTAARVQRRLLGPNYHSQVIVSNFFNGFKASFIAIYFLRTEQYWNP